MRVPTYSNMMNMSAAIQNHRNLVDKYTYQSMSGLKHQEYSGYGMKAYNIVSMESTLQLTNTFMENNKLANITLNTSNLAIQTITDALADVKTALTDLNGTDLKKISPDATGGQLSFTSDNVADYMGKTLTISGTTYTFANTDGDTNINIAAATDAKQIMQAVADKVPSVEYSEENEKISFPLYSVDGYSTLLSEEPTKSSVKMGTPHTMNSEQLLALENVQRIAFSTMQMIADTLNSNVAGKYIYGGGSSTRPVKFDYANLNEFQQYYDGVNTLYPSSSSAVLSNLSVDSTVTGDLHFEQVGGKQTITAAQSFAKQAIVMNAANTGSVTLDSASNTMKATEYGAFSSLHEGDSIILGGDNPDLGNNAKAYVIKSISADGRTVTFETDAEGHSVIEDTVTLSPDNDVVVSKSFPIGTVINLDGFADNNLAPTATVLGISDDGKELYVKADEARFPTKDVTNNKKWSISAESYFQGGDLEYNQRISESQTISFDIKASDPAFEKIFRALGQIAQGHIVDMSDPLQTGAIDSQKTARLVEDAMTLISSAVGGAGDIASGKNSSLYSVTAKISAEYTVLNKVVENQKLAASNLENNISTLKDADKQEAAVKLLLSESSLEASYTVLSEVSKLSLLNYIK